MNEGTMQKSSWDMLYLIACVLHSEVPESQKVHEMDLADLYKTAQFHTLTAMTAMALESAGAFRHAAPDLTKKWKEAKEKAIRKNMLLDAERGQILQYMEREGIWYVPLKGSLLKDLYPKYGMRQMADNDILYDKTYQKQMLRFMKERGYEAETVGKIHHDAYIKPPVYNFELHTELFGQKSWRAWHEYYKNIKERLVRDTESSFGCHFREEDFYIYLTAHAYKHYDNRGTGLRSLVDTYVYVWKKGDSLDWDYIERELEKLKIADFERQSRCLAEKLLSEPSHFDEIILTDEECVMLSYFSGSGTYGSTKNRVEKKMKEMAADEKPFTGMNKLRYLWKRLFPDIEWFERYAPFCVRHRWLIPFFLVYRTFRGLTFRRKNLKSEIRAVKNIDKEE